MKGSRCLSFSLRSNDTNDGTDIRSPPRSLRSSSVMIGSHIRTSNNIKKKEQGRGNHDGRPKCFDAALVRPWHGDLLKGRCERCDPTVLGGEQMGYGYVRRLLYAVMRKN